MWLDRYFKGEKPQISELPLAPVGSEFQKEIWKLPYHEGINTDKLKVPVKGTAL